jgi:hypothetical protein
MKLSYLKKWALITFLLQFLVSLTLQANQEVLSSYRVDSPTEQQLAEIAARYEIASREGASYEVVVPRIFKSNFLKIAPEAQLVTEDLREELVQSLARNQDYLADYRSYDQVYSYLQGIAERYPQIATLQTYGKSSKGNPLYVLKLTNKNSRFSSKPALLIDAATHGDEIITTEVLLRLLEQLVQGYGNDAEITRFIDRTTLLFVPVVNADGFVSRNRYESGYTDPNRSYPYPGEPSRKPATCIAALISLANQERIAGALDIHAYGELIMYPWAYTTVPIDEAATQKDFDSLTTAMSANNGYKHGQISKLIYVAKGSSADYYYWKMGTLAIALEIGRSKAPAGREIERQVTAIKPALWTFIRRFAG